jgi:ketopantoate reductase
MSEGSAGEVHVIGMGEVGRHLAGALERSGWTIHPVTRDRGWDACLDENDLAIRLVAVREEALAAVLERLPSSLGDRLVLVQNGFLEAVHGDLGPVTRGLIYFSSKGDFYRELCPSIFYGPHGRVIASALAAGGVAVEAATDAKTYLEAMIVKGIWNAVVGLPLAVHGVDLETYLRDHRAEFEALVAESAAAAAAEYGVPVTAEAAVEKILATTGDLGWVRGGAKALDWRNGAIVAFGRRHGVPTPINDRLMERASS